VRFVDRQSTHAAQQIRPLDELKHRCHFLGGFSMMQANRVSSSLRHLAGALLLWAFVVMTPDGLRMFAQQSSVSGIAGRVTDSTGAVVAGATIHVINQATAAERTTVSNNDGDFSMPNLPPATYDLRVEKSGFKTTTIPSLELLVGKTADQSVTLTVGEASETVQVTSLAPQLQTTDAAVGQVIDQRQISNLPLNGRSVLQLATLAAGVSPAQFSNTGTPGQFGTRSLYITVDGGRASSTNYVLDGVYIRSLRFNVLSMQPSVDTLQEFNLLRSSFSTEYGQGQAAVSMVTKSGGNQIHGSLFEYTRSSIFDARNYFSTYTVYPHKPVFHRNQFGGTIGAPIIKDKVFIFAGYEGLRSSQSIPQLGIFPTPTQLGTPTYLFAQVLQPSFPVPNCTSCGTNNYSITAIEPNDYDQGVVRADQTFSSKHSLFERYVYYTASEIVPSVQSGVYYPQLAHNVSVGDTYLISSSMVNEVRLGYNRAYGFTDEVNPVPGKNWVALAGLTNVSGGVTPSEYGRPSITITGYTGLGEGGNSQGDTENIYSAGDTLSDVVGKHTFRVGAQFQWRQVRQLTDTPARGSFTFASVQTYQTGVCSICQAGSGSSLGHYTDNTYGIFMNDVWQIAPRLTFNYGLRWEYASPFIEKNGLAGMFDPVHGLIAFHKVPANIPPALLPNVNTTANYFPAGMVQPDKRGFGPRLGVAYSASPGTVFRVGYGIYFDNTNINELQFTRNVPPFYFNATINNASFITQQLMPSLNQLTAIPAPFSLSPGNRVPYTQEWTTSVQQDLGHSTVFELSYTGSVTHKLWKRFDQNQNAFPVVGGPAGAQPYPNFLHGLLTSLNEGGSDFNGLSAKLEQRSRNGLYYLINYQWSKNLDNNSGEADSNDTSYATHFSFDRSYSNYDTQSRAVASAGYELPFGKGKPFLNGGGISNVIAGGWQIQPIVQLRSGFPFSVSAGSGSCTCGTYVPQRANLAPGRTSGRISNRTPLHWFDSTAYVTPAAGVQGTVTRNTLRGPATAEFDFSALKNFAITERLTAQFRAEAFNIINHPNFGNPSANISTGNVGTITATSFDNRDLQFALKLLW
jgi:Carboxypeptidase regulatory-like domain/TonB-dependent Receptor Plug Domain/TonB dependent receptor